jgi:predicted N-acetyltransferase YhbS
VTIRAALPEEIERVRAAYAEWGYSGGVASGDVVLVAETEGRLLGLVRRTREFETVMLRGMHVAPDARHQGVGTRLLEAFVRALNGQECYCVPYRHLVQFYGRQGFELRSVEAAPAFLVGRLAQYRAKGIDAVLMRRPAISSH